MKVVKLAKVVKLVRAAVGGDANGEAGDRGEVNPQLWEDRSASSRRIVFTCLATVAGLLLERDASAKVFALLDGGEVVGGVSGCRSVLEPAVAAVGEGYHIIAGGSWGSGPCCPVVGKLLLKSS